MKTLLERDADEFDCDLYRLILRAERRAEGSTPVNRAKWDSATRELRGARVHVRQMMSEKDREAT